MHTLFIQFTYSYSSRLCTCTCTVACQHYQTVNDVDHAWIHWLFYHDLHVDCAAIQDQCKSSLSWTLKGQLSNRHEHVMHACTCSNLWSMSLMSRWPLFSFNITTWMQKSIWWWLTNVGDESNEVRFAEAIAVLWWVEDVLQTTSCAQLHHNDPHFR